MSGIARLTPAVLAGFLVLACSPARAERTVVDQIGETVRLPDRVERAVILQHQTLNIAAQLGVMNRVAGVLGEWKAQLGAGFQRLAPGVEKLPTPGGLTQVNIEELVAAKPDVVFVTNYAPAEMRERIKAVGLPVVAVSLLTVPKDEAVKLNPAVEDEAVAYDQGLKDGIRLIAGVFGTEPAGEALIERATKSRALVAERLADVKEADRVRVYMANPDMMTYGRGKYTGLMMIRAGATNVAAASLKGFQRATIEDVIAWNPAVIFVQDRYPALPDQIRNDAAWRTVKAVAEGKVLLMPEYAKAWGYPMPEALALGELWMAKALYPARFADIDMDALADDYYRNFYRVPYKP
jgi:iron complex transport system substrate-binding protein